MNSTVISELVDQAQACLDRAPREARSLAQAAYESARAGGNPLEQAESALALAIVLNRLGEFREARSLADEAAFPFSHHGDHEKSARAFCESAWADTFIGDLDQAIEEVARARALNPAALLAARCDWIEARVWRDQSDYSKAAGVFEKASQEFQAAGLPLEAARCERDLAEALIRSERSKGLLLLERLRALFENAGCALDVALCDYLTASGLFETGQFGGLPELLTTTRHKLADLGAGFFAAWCDVVLGSTWRRLNRLDDALQTLHQARDYFLAHGIRMLVAICDINLGNVYYVLNRYDEALGLYQEAADLSVAEGRQVRAAHLYTNMGLVYAKQGLWSKALDLHHRALQIATAKELFKLAAGSLFCLAGCYRELGQLDQAFNYMQRTRTMAMEHNLAEAQVQCDIVLGDIYVAMGQVNEGVACLEEARSIALAEGLDSLVAVCDRLRAQAAIDLTRGEALALIANARETFLKHTQAVDAALCDLTEGELWLQWTDYVTARVCFERAHQVLAPAFPDQAWRAEHGLARCASAEQNRPAALEHYLAAVRTIAGSRSRLVTEQLSNDFFAHRQSVYDEALSLALAEGAVESSLEVIEASKARTFLTLLAQRSWKLPHDHDDPYLTDLLTREKQLRYQLDTLRGRLAVQVPSNLGEVLRGVAELAAISSAALAELNALGQAYESVVTQIRLAMSGLAGVAEPLPFALDQFRAVVNAAIGTGWAALDYYLTDDTLTVVVVEPDHIKAECHKLSSFDRAILEKCTGTEPDLRELVYRGTLHGDPVTQVGTKYMQHLYRLLIPPGLAAAALMIAPHAALHALPFHALMDGTTYLVERHTVLYTPSLQALQLSLKPKDAQQAQRPLGLGISHFHGRARELPFACAEVEQLHQVFKGEGECLLEGQATRQRILDLNASGALAKFDLIHLATHAILDRAAPHQSRVLLCDDALTAMDIFDLALNARLVTLSACQTALGKGGSGDEWLGLVRAFFYAGAQALLATLWSVEDNAMADLTGRFYRYWAEGKDGAEALRQVALEMIREGQPPYRWAPFVLVGQP